MRKLWLAVSLACSSLALQACGGGGPSVTHLGVVVTGSATAGTTFSVTINALGPSGNVVASYMGTVQITSSDPQAVLPGNTTLVNGTATVQITFRTAGNQTIMVTDTTHALNSGTGSVSVTAAQVSQLSVTSLAASISAGTAFNITVSGADAFNNVVASYAGTVHFTSSDSQAVLPSDTKLQNGTASFSVTLKTAGVQTIMATDTANASLGGTSAGINVNPGAVTHISVSAPPAVTTNLAFMVTVSAADNFGNPVPSYTGTIKFTSSDAQAALPMNSALTNGTQTFPVTLVTIGSETITATDTATASLRGTSGSINVVTNVATHLSITGPASSFTRQTITMTVTALDAANNTSTGYAGTVHFTSSDAQAKLPGDSTLAMGTASFSVTFETAGTDTIAATDTTKSSITGMASGTVTAPADLKITSGNPRNGTVGVRYDQRTVRICVFVMNCFNVTEYGFPLAASGGISPYTWSWVAASGSMLPQGLDVVNKAVGCGFRYAPPCIVGTPSEPGTFNVVVTLTDAGTPSVQGSANYTITIALPPPPVVNATPAPLPRGEELPYSFTFTATGYPPFTWSESGSLPTGLMFDSSTGTLSGTPTQTGSFPIMVTATDQFNQKSTSANFTIIITAHGFVATGSMSTPRRFHTATLLPNGKVLVAGGEDAGSTAFSSAELYDPATGMFTPTTHNMTVARAGHTATLLNNGKVLIAGGATDATEAATDTAELYDPATDTFTAASGPMTAARVAHTATLLQNGKVLIAGGDIIFYNNIQNTTIMSLASAEIFDPGTGVFTKTGNMTVPRESHTATLLDSGKVLIAGGSAGTLGNSSPAATLYATSETFDPSTGTFTAAGTMTTQRDFFTASLLGNGKVLAAGGLSNAADFLETADLFDPTSASFAATGNMTAIRFYHDASVLNDGTVLLTGGSDGNNRALDSAEIYDPAAGTFAITGSMLSIRVWHTSTLLPNGKVLVTGGADNSSAPVATAELYQ